MKRQIASWHACIFIELWRSPSRVRFLAEQGRTFMGSTTGSAVVFGLRGMIQNLSLMRWWKNRLIYSPT
jgi:hypothetical protein